jgi:dihydroorotate dehydrogenase
MKKAVASQGQGQLLIAGVVGTIKHGFTDEDYFNDFAETAKLAASTGVKAIEINFSCPNVASEGVLCYSHDSVVTIAEKTKQLVGRVPLIGKLGYFTTDQQDLREQIIIDSSPYLAAYSAINTIPASVVDENGNQMLPGEGRLRSGICGAGVKWAGVDMVRRLDAIRKQHNLKFEIIGIGGVMTPKDFLDYRLAGADVVQSVTAAMWNANLAAEIKRSLKS